ncbi:MAG: RluA family pseudouridine synthase [Gammaproteobacteria bacterium]|nr:RluA family pseudouridine synthase [Gammaproteobacteria bacterium]
MCCITYLSPPPQPADLPLIFPSPFNNTPHAIAKKASEQLQDLLNNQFNCPHDFDAPEGGKMFGVLVVKDQNNNIGFLSGFSGMLAGKWRWPGFVPELFDLVERDSFLPAGEAALADFTSQIFELQSSQKYRDLQKQLKQQEQERDAAWLLLKQSHKARKALRDEQRKALQNNDALFTELARESQQDKRELKDIKTEWIARLVSIQVPLNQIDGKIERLKKARAELSSKLHKQVFSTYRLTNFFGEQQEVSTFYKGQKPPGGAGDCAAPKLIQYANRHHLLPLALAEFWWGASPKEGVRHHGFYYPSCRGKCWPILPFMLQGLDVQPPTELVKAIGENEPVAVYEDDDLFVVNKPHGLLSVPGKEVQDSVLTRLQKRYPKATGALLVHRLDLSTSGLLLVAKNSETHKALQKQFLKRTIKKRYVAVLSKELPEDQSQGVIELPLRVDIDDRPRQCVCFTHGKLAKTHWKVIERKRGRTRVYFYPVTGRTHQLRVHASHKDGLNTPIEGDELYGAESERLLLHAERLIFIHPATGQRIEVRVAAPF